MVETLGFCDFGTINCLRENLEALDQNDSQMEAMKNEDLNECPLCDKTYYKSGLFKKHIEKKHCWKFCSFENMDADSNTVHFFLLMSLLQ